MARMRYARQKELSQATLALLAASAAILTCPSAADADDARGVLDHAIAEAHFSADAGKEIAPKFRNLFAPTARWADALHWKYNHANAPAALSGNKAAVISQVRSSLDKWTAQCG